jgi:undecaprenyl-diphosphatase
MSTDWPDTDAGNTRDVRRRRLAAAGFIALLLLSVCWPSPVVSINALTLHQPLAVDDLSFLGREAPAWDVAFWCIAGLFALALLHPAGYEARDFAILPRRARAVLRRPPAAPLHIAAALIALVAAVAVTWFFADAPLIRAAEHVQSDAIEDCIRILNRLGGGSNPGLVVLFFALAGVTLRSKRWISYAVAMALSGITAGILVQAIKFAVGRTRPELWLGPFHHTRAAASSFPSGHTVGAFAIGGVLMFASRSRSMRIVTIILAVAIGASRVLAFRHWPSDVLASAIAGSFTAWWFAKNALETE